MAIPTYSIITTRPRTFANAADLAVKKASRDERSHPIAGKYWNDVLKPYVSNTHSYYRNNLDEVVGKNDLHDKLLTFLLVYWIEGGGTSGQTSEATAAATTAKALLAYAVNYDASDDSSQVQRSFNIALALGFDFLFDDLTESERNDIADKIYANRLFLGWSAKELMDGASGGQMAAQLVGAIATFGYGDESPAGVARRQNALAILTEALQFWFFLASAEDKGRISYNQYFMTDGGGGKGTAYEHLAFMQTVWLLEAFSNGLQSVHLNGQPYDILTAETWIQKISEWFLRVSLRGDFDYHNINDTRRVDKPFFNSNERVSYAFLCAHGGPWRKNMRWLYDLKRAKSIDLGHESAYGQALPWLLFDWDDADNEYEPPSQSVPVPDRSRLFSPPGSYWYHNTWDVAAIDGKTPGVNNCIINIHCPTFFFYGHTDLDVGSIRINVRDDQVVCKRGVYDTTTDAADFGGDHNIRWKKQTISCSGVVLVDDGKGEPNFPLGRPHRTRVSPGITTAVSHAQGGQLYKQNANGDIDPNDALSMSQEGDGKTWRRVNAFYPDENTTQDPGMKLVESTEDFDYLTADLRRAYIREEADAGQDEERVSLYKAQWMVIKRDFELPVIFMHHRVQSREASMVRKQIWNFWGRPYPFETEVFPTGPHYDFNFGKWYEHLNACLFEAGGLMAHGDLAVSDSFGVGAVDPSTQGGRCTIAYYSPAISSEGVGVRFTRSGSNWTRPATGSNLPKAHGYQVDGATEYHPPGVEPSDPISLNLRETIDVGKYRLEVQILDNTGTDTTNFVCLVIPRVAERLGPTGLESYHIPNSMFIDGSPHTFRFSESDGFYVLSVTGRQGLRTFKLHQTTDEYSAPGSQGSPIDPPPDTIPPGPPQQLSVEPGSAKQLVLNWNANPTEDGVNNYRLYQREVIT